MFGSPATAVPAPPLDRTPSPDQVRARTALPRRVVAARVLREVVLWVAAAIGLLCLLVAAAAMLFHVTPLVFRTGSMSPGIPTGSVGLSQPIDAADVRVGQIVSVIRADGARVTHRVAAVTLQGDAASITLKGDANAAADPDPVVTTDIRRVFWSTPHVGYLLQDVAHPPVVFVGGALLGMIAMWGFRRPTPLPGEDDPEGPDGSGSGTGPGSGSGSGTESGSGRGPQGAPVPMRGRHVHARSGLEARGRAVRAAHVPRTGRPRHSARPGRAVRPVHSAIPVSAVPAPRSAVRGHLVGLVAATVVVTLGATIGLGADPAIAAPWTDTATAQTTDLKAGSLTAPQNFTCSASASTGVALTWTPPASTSLTPDRYTITVANGGLATNLTGSGDLPPTARSYSYSAASTSLLAIGAYTFTLTAWVGPWSASAPTRTTRVLTSVLINCS